MAGGPDISVTVDHDRAVVVLRGEHETYSAERLARRLDALVDGGISVSVDLREATFIDSTVVGTLLAAKRRADTRSLAFVLVLGDDTGWAVRRILE